MQQQRKPLARHEWKDGHIRKDFFHSIQFRRTAVRVYTNVPHYVTHFSLTGDFDWGADPDELHMKDLALNIIEAILRNVRCPETSIPCQIYGKAHPSAIELAPKLSSEILTRLREDGGELKYSEICSWVINRVPGAAPF